VHLSVFATFTCNPAWRGVVRQLAPGQTPAESLDLTARVFELKLIMLLDHFINSDVLGKVIAYCHAMSFRSVVSLMLIFLLILSRVDKITSPEQVDENDIW